MSFSSTIKPLQSSKLPNFNPAAVPCVSGEEDSGVSENKRFLVCFSSMVDSSEEGLRPWLAAEENKRPSMASEQFYEGDRRRFVNDRHCYSHKQRGGLD